MISKQSVTLAELKKVIVHIHKVLPLPGEKLNGFKWKLLFFTIKADSLAPGPQMRKKGNNVHSNLPKISALK